MKTIFAICLVIGLSAGCASTPVKQQAVVSLAASEQALEAAHDMERALCNPTADKTKPVTECVANAIGLTTAIHQQVAVVFSKAFSTEILAANALRAWKSGEPAPASLADYQRDLLEIVAVIRRLLPQATDLIGKTQSAADEAKKTAAAAAAAR
jgi:hypothetical protein